MWGQHGNINEEIESKKKNYGADKHNNEINNKI